MEEDEIRDLHDEFKEFVEDEIADESNKSLTIKPFSDKKIGHECYTVILDNVNNSLDIERFLKKIKEFDDKAYPETTPTIDGRSVEYTVHLPILKKNHKYREKKPIEKLKRKRDLNSSNSSAIRWLIVFLISTVLFLLTTDFKNIIQ